MTGRRLIILDLNGTILNRLTHENEFKLFRRHPIVMKRDLSTDITIHGSKIMFRPHRLGLLEHLLQHFDVAVWTSSRPKNAFAMVHYSFGPLLDFKPLRLESKRYGLSARQVLLGQSDQKAKEREAELMNETKNLHRLAFIWTQEECDTIENERLEGGKYIKPLRKKDLTKVWTAFPQYSPQNTIIVDDTREKLAEHNENHLVIPEFNITNHDVDFTADDHLLHLKSYFEALLQVDPQDVRIFLANKPYN